MMSRPDYAIVTGQGRSGTTWLLELLDFGFESFCRNEPYGMDGSPLRTLLDHRFQAREDQQRLEETWDSAIAWTATHMGARDLPIAVPKSYLRPLSRSLGLYDLVQKKRTRSALVRVMRSLRGEEWPLPSWLAHPARLATALPILKFVAAPGWMSFVLRQRPSIPVFHIVRHPGGFLNSWSTRYLAHQDPHEVIEANRQRLRGIAELDVRWAERFGDIEAMSVEALELAYWVYANQVVHDAGQGSDLYFRVVYERLASDPVPVMRDLYAACGLPFGDDVERRVRESGSQSGEIASAWRDRLNPQQLELVERTVADGLVFYEEAAAPAGR